ncbi:MAG: riboflavin biosynthesis protein RibD [Gemmatimonadetes bacterium]|nr:riboflavin biosynthesis protein RibD [Gemmatimonadota bacterium]
MTESEAMDHALAIAWRGWGRVHPNPMVGAVVLRDGAAVGQGAHERFGGPHAEVVALGEAGPRAQGATMVVTLEPCRHHGKQPPCVDAIVAAGVRRVLFGAGDPNPDAGGGAAALAAAGIEVARLPVADRVAGQNAAFFHAHRDTSRPFVALKLATSVDARVADYTGRARWISGPAAREWVHWLRAGFDAIGVGGRTARTDNPSLTVRGSVIPRVPPRRVVFDRQGDLDGAGLLVETAATVPVLLVTEAPLTAARAAAMAAAGVTVVVAHGLADALGRLREEGIRSVLVEGGGRLAARLMGHGLVDRFYWVQSPLWLGEGGMPAFAGLGGSLLEQAARWRVVDRQALGEDTLLVLDRPVEEGD